MEVGSFKGCSTSHLALACARNGKGKVYAVDPSADFASVDPGLLAHVVPVKEDVFAWTPPAAVDFLFEDGAHRPGFTAAVLEKLRATLTPGGLALCHDSHQAEFGEHISAEFTAAMGAGARSVVIAPSDCGLGYARVG